MRPPVRKSKTSVQSTPARARLRAQILNALTAGVGSMVLASTVSVQPVAAAALPSAGHVIERTDSVRTRWALLKPGEPDSRAADHLAWWRNWGNGWHPWWHNWPNWRNWHNWGNGPGGCQLPG